MNSVIEPPTMGGKPIFEVPAKGVINLKSGFAQKLLCDGPTFSLGSACVYSCSFCYVGPMMARNPHLAGIGLPHESIVIRRKGALQALRSQLLNNKGLPRYSDPGDRRVIYSSPLVDVAANMELVRETVAACTEILTHTHWQIRLLSKSSLLRKVAEAFATEPWKSRLIYGVSTGTLDDRIAAVFEQGTAKVSKRLEALWWLQDHGFRTFGMICPSLPQRDYAAFGQAGAQAIRQEHCEHVWAEALNARGPAFARTAAALRSGKFEWEAAALEAVAASSAEWEDYSRSTFEGHAPCYPQGKLRFLQYVSAQNLAYWAPEVARGAVLL